MYKDFKEAIHKANDSAYGLQAGVFLIFYFKTKNIQKIK